MSATSQQRSYLQDTFYNRVTFDSIERKLYSHDIAAMPSLFKPIIGNTTPDAVVPPENEQELIELCRWASRNRIPLKPAAKPHPVMVVCYR